MRRYARTCSMGIHRKSVWLNLQEILSLNTSFPRGRFALFSIERSLRIDLFFFFFLSDASTTNARSQCSVFFPSKNIERKENWRLKDNGGGKGDKGAKGRRSGTLNYEYPWKRRPTD